MSNSNCILAVERLREILSFEPETGVFTWRIKPAQNVAVGAQAGYINNRGYRQISIDDKPYQAHRLAWLHVFGEWPDADIDHINGDKSDNRIANLRSVSRAVNAQNLHSARKDSSTGLLGAHLHSSGKFQAQIRINGSAIHLGTFSTAEEAHAAYVAAKRANHPGCTI